MPLVSQQIPSYKGGVSQQPAILRYPDQVEELLNGYPSEVEGLQKRPPTEHIGRLRNKDSLGHKYHIINRDEKEQYILELSKGGIKVWDMKGNAQKVTIKDDADYLNCNDPEKDFRAVTVADYTFILNRNKVVTMQDDVTADGYSNRTLMYVKNAQYAKVYSIWLNDAFKYGLLTPDGGEAKQAVQTSTSFIARGLYNLAKNAQTATVNSFDGLVNQTGGAANVVYGKANAGDYSNVWLYGDSTLMFEGHNWEIKDSFGGQNAYSIKNYTTSATKLPPAAPNGYKVHVKGNTSSSDDDYWLEWSSTKSAWVESCANGIKYKINASTMPHALVREADGTFVFKKLEWSDRKVGDEDSNPEPSFIDKTISDIFFYRNRLGVVSEENIIMSASADFFNFWFNSAVQVIDTDPIDVAISDNRVAIIDSAVPFSRELMLFSKEGQFVLSADGVLTPKTVKVDKITSFDYSTTCSPVSIGQSIFFINDKVDYCSLMRFYTVQDVADLKDAEDVSAHIPTYIPIGISRLSGNTKDDILLLTSRTHPNTVWLYKYILQGGQSLQEAWCKWELGSDTGKVLLAECVDSFIYLLVETEGGLWLERMQIRGTAKDFIDEPYRLYIDRKLRYVVPSNAEYNEYLDTTTVYLSDIYGGSVDTTNSTYYFVDTQGYVREFTNTDKCVFDGDLRNTVLFVGRKFKFYTELSQQMIRSSDNSGVTAEDEGRLQLRYYWVNYSNSGVFKCIVSNERTNAKYEYLSTNRYLGESTNQLGVNKLFTGKFRFPVQNNSSETTIEIVSDNPQPLIVISGGFEGFYFRRNQRV